MGVRGAGSAPPLRAGLVSCFGELVDLLIGYTLDPHLPDQVRHTHPPS